MASSTGSRSAWPALTSLAGFTQSTRVLMLHTPLSDDVLLAESLHGEEGIDTGFRLHISALSSDASLPLRPLLGQAVLLELLTGPGKATRPFHGHVTAAEICGANGGLARYKLTVEPWTAFLGLGRDSRVFQGKSVIDILDILFASYQGKGQLAPAWRIDADPSLYPVRSLATQYQESDLAFALRLMSEEGLFGFFEHDGDPSSASLGSHTLVIADSNDVFKPNPQDQVRFTQSGAAMSADSVDRWRTESRLLTNAVDLRSWDYRTRSLRAASVAAGEDIELRSVDAPGAYAYATRAHGQRIAERQLQAFEAARQVHLGAGTVRSFMPGTTFTLSDHSTYDGADSDFLIVRVRHLAHNNLSADLTPNVAEGLGQDPVASLGAAELSTSLHAAGQRIAERPVYRNSFDAIRANVPYRGSRADGHGRLLHPRPTVKGQQTAIVVGPPGMPVYTDRDHRIKVQFHWQRGLTAHSRLEHPAPEGHTGAPGDERAGTWVRVATALTPIAGANWGSHALPRVGQEVLVDFLDGDIDRPVVIGALYNGRGAADAQHNQVAYGAGAATGNAGAWFPGTSGAHAHPAILSGIKSQAMQDSANGTGAYSQLVFDDSAGQARIALQRHARAHEGTAELNLGHLRHQVDNGRLAAVGFGAELKTGHSAAIRARLGLLLSGDATAGAGGAQMDAHAAQQQIKSSNALQTSLAETATKHKATLPGESSPDEMPALAQLAGSGAAIGTNVQAAGSGGGGAAGGTTAFDQPQIQLTASSGIAATAAASAVLASGATGSVTAGQDIDITAQGGLQHAVKDGISLFTYGKASNADKPTRETGIRLHAASGKLSSQTQSAPTRLTADKAITVASVTKTVTSAAKDHLLMTAQGASLKLEGGNIMLHCPGTVSFKATMKELAGPQRAYGPDLAFKRPDALRVESIQAQMSARLIIDGPLQNLIGATSGGTVPYRLLDHTGALIARGTLDDKGATRRVFHDTQRDFTVLLGEPGAWNKIEHEDDDAGCGCGDELHVDDQDHDHASESGPLGTAVSPGAGSEQTQDTGNTPSPISDEAPRLQLLDQLVFADPEVRQAINDGEA